MQHNILLESGTNEVEIIEVYIDEVEDGKVHRRSFGVNVAKVKKIFRRTDLKNFSGSSERRRRLAEPKVDMKNPAVLGMYEFMDHVIPLIDLSKWLEMEVEESSECYVVVTEFNQIVSSFLVSGVNRIHRIGWDEIEPLDENMLKYAGNTIIGTVKLGNPERIMQILDLERAIGEINPEMAFKDEPDVNGEYEQKYLAITADDSMAMRNAVTSALTRGGFSITSFTNGLDAWKHLEELKAEAKSQQVPITDLVQLVVTDIEMPMMDGHALTKRIKEDRILNKLNVFLFSSLITDALRHKGERVGANRQYSKPQITELVQHAREDSAALLSGRF